MEQAQNREVALRLTGIKKKYKLGQIGGGPPTCKAGGPVSGGRKTPT